MRQRPAPPPVAGRAPDALVAHPVRGCTGEEEGRVMQIQVVEGSGAGREGGASAGEVACAGGGGGVCARGARVGAALPAAPVFVHLVLRVMVLAGIM